MKRGRLLIFKITFLLTFYFCVGINTFSFLSIKTINTELSSCTCNDEICVYLDCDSINEYPIAQSYNPFISHQLFCQIPPHQKSFPIKGYYSSVWQPPKFS